jgi:hypothetical protein
MGGDSKPNLGPQPAAPQPMDYNALMTAASAASANAFKSELQSQIAAYPKLESLQLGTVNKIAGNLNDANTKQGQDIINQTLSQSTNALQQTGNRIGAQADQVAQLGTFAASNAQGPNSLEQALYETTKNDLAHGYSLTPEQQRLAEQGAIGSMASRGLATGDAGAAAEILGRFNTSNAMYQQRLNNAAAADQTVNTGVIGRQNAATGMLSQAGNLYGQSGGAYQNAASLGLQGANALVNIDPYQRALGTGVSLGSSIQGQSGQMIGNTFNAGQQLAGDVASFNQNMQGNLYNSWMNNQAAMYGAQQQANAMMVSGGLQALGSIGGGAMSGGLGAAGGFGKMFCWVAREVYGVEDPAWVEFRHWLLTRGSARRIARYAAHGPKIAAWIAEHPAWKTRLRRWMDACRAQLSA